MSLMMSYPYRIPLLEDITVPHYEYDSPTTDMELWVGFHYQYTTAWPFGGIFDGGNSFYSVNEYSHGNVIRNDVRHSG